MNLLRISKLILNAALGAIAEIIYSLAIASMAFLICLTLSFKI